MQKAPTRGTGATEAGARKIANDKSYDRVDGMVTLGIALGLYHREPPECQSVYADRGVITLSA